MRTRTTLIVMLFILAGALDVSAKDDIELQSFEVLEGVILPFPHEPESLGEMRSEAFLERGWRADKKNVGFTATVMLDGPEVTPDFDARAILFSFSANVARTMGGDIISREITTISDLPALVMRVRLGQFQVEGRSKNVFIYQNGRVHSWAIQYIVMENQNLAETVFEKGLRSIEFR